MPMFVLSLILFSFSAFGSEALETQMDWDSFASAEVVESDLDAESNRFQCGLGVLTMRGSSFSRNVFRGRGDSHFNARFNSFDLYHRWISQNKFYSEDFNHFFVFNNCF